MVRREPRGLYATAIIVTDKQGRQRWFREWNKGGRLHTAWCLAGARLFLDEPEAIEHPDTRKIKARLTREGRNWRQVVVSAEP